MPDQAVRLRLDPSAHGPSQARQFVEARLAHLPPAVLYDLTVVVSELVTNAIRHGEEPVALELSATSAAIRVTVHDCGPSFDPGRPRLPGPGSEGGRGLVIVASLTDRWGITADPAGRGKAVWFDVAI